jgi:hypothetical protein
MVEEVFRWDFHFLGLDVFIEVDCNSRVGRWVERHISVREVEA